MKLCQNCGQLLAEEMTSCPSCGNEVVEGRKTIDDYRIDKILHEGYSSILCKCRKEGMAEPVMIRIFTPQSGVNEKIAARLKHELEELKKLPGDYFVRHLDIRKSSDGLWYRVSEWIDSENWSNLLASGCFQDYTVAFKLFYRIASILEGLHRIGHFIPHLMIDDIMVTREESNELNVKIDYKLSRFLDPKMDRPGPLLEKLLTSHPDIVNHRPLDYRSDIWSLGKIFVEILTADFEPGDYPAAIDKLALPREIAVLFKIMLAEDPDLRPRSMAEVAGVLARVREEDIEAASHDRLEAEPVPARQIKGLRKRLTLLVVMVAVLGLLIVALAWYYFSFRKADSAALLLDYANQYAGSVAFIMVDYQLLDGTSVAYHNRAEGTAFLVDRDGYLLTSRHVACPWLEDGNLHMMIHLSAQQQRPLRLSYRTFLWFEGARAFIRLPGFSGSTELEDVYSLDLSFRTGGARRLIIAGVARPPTKTWQLVKSPLRDDFAVLKIDPVPAGLKPLPLDDHLDPLKIARLSPVITLGFPLGSQTQEATVNVSVTRGHVRRTFENLIQVDTSIHSGNSGGPIIDTRGKVIGIASGVAVGWSAGPVPIATPLSDIGMILPITSAVNFIQDLKAGRTKWDGILDLSIDARIEKITAAAKQGKWSEAAALADQELRQSFDPALVMAAGMMHFCSGDAEVAAKLFIQALSVDEENTLGKLMLFLIDWRTGSGNDSVYRRELLALDWRSPGEFYGHLGKILAGRVSQEVALSGGYTDAEKSWLHYLVSLIRIKQGDRSGAEKLLKQAILAADIDDWLYFLALSELTKIQEQHLKTLPEPSDRDAYEAQIRKFAESVKSGQAARAERRTRLAPLTARLKQEALSPEDKVSLLEQILLYETDNAEILIGLAFYGAMSDRWEMALGYARKFLKWQGRETADRLSAGLLEAEILHQVAGVEAARTQLEDYYRRTADPWYRALSGYLAGRLTEQSLVGLAEENPDNLLTWHTALGFWAEGSGDRQAAVRHYKEALGSYLDTRIEYEFAGERIKRIRKQSE